MIEAGGGWICWRCGDLVLVGEPWDLGHVGLPRALGGDDSNLAPEHRSCSRRAGAELADAMKRGGVLVCVGKPGQLFGDIMIRVPADRDHDEKLIMLVPHDGVLPGGPPGPDHCSGQIPPHGPEENSEDTQTMINNGRSDQKMIMKGQKLAGPPDDAGLWCW